MPVTRNCRLLSILLSAAWLLGLIEIAQAQASPNQPNGGLRAPQAVVLYVHMDLKNTAFLDPLVCALQSVLVAPVSIQELPLPLGRELLATSTQLDVSKMAERFREAPASESGALIFKHLFIAPDLTARPYNYLFASTFGTQGGPDRLQVVSLARLDRDDPKRTPAERTELPARRLYKIVLRSIVQNAGYRSNGCILAFPRSLEELDGKSPHFCTADRSALVEVGILKAVESSACAAVASRMAALLILATIKSGRLWGDALVRKIFLML